MTLEKDESVESSNAYPVASSASDQSKLGARETPVAPLAGERRSATAGTPEERSRLTEVEREISPESPVTRMLYSPPSAAPVPLMVMMVDEPGVTGLTENETVVPSGSPE